MTRQEIVDAKDPRTRFCSGRITTEFPNYPSYRLKSNLIPKVNAIETFDDLKAMRRSERSEKTQTRGLSRVRIKTSGTLREGGHYARLGSYTNATRGCGRALRVIDCDGLDSVRAAESVSHLGLRGRDFNQTNPFNREIFPI